MSRVIKFRAWGDEWKNPHLPIVTPAGWVTDVSNALLGMNGKIYESYYDLCQIGGPGDRALTVEQFTGLLDKQGREIYEGDIVDVDRFDDNNGPWRGVIEWWHLGFHLFHVYKGEIHREYGPATLEWRRPVTIVGNVHENPELLKT